MTVMPAPTSRAGASVWRVAVTVPASAADMAEETLGQAANGHGLLSIASFEADAEGSRRTIEATTAQPPDRAALTARLALLGAAFGLAEPVPTIERIPPTDWLAATAQAFPPIAVGRFHIYGSHRTEPVPAGRIGLRIDAATAFGTGEHPSTAGCLIALGRLVRRRRVRWALDLGCGTAVLAIATAKLWRRPVVAADFDPEAVRVARINVRANMVARQVRVVRSDGYRAPAIGARRPYDLIAANILARPLARLARDLQRHLAPGGVAVLAGLLARQEAQVLTAHRRQGLRLVGRIVIAGWPTLILARGRCGQCGSVSSRR